MIAPRFSASSEFGRIGIKQLLVLKQLWQIYPCSDYFSASFEIVIYLLLNNFTVNYSKF